MWFVNGRHSKPVFLEKMPHVFYDVLNAAVPPFDMQIGDGDYFVGHRWQRGYGFRRQYGRGVGTLLMKAYRYLMPLARQHLGPLAKQAASALAQQGAESGSKILSDIAKGEDPREAMITHGTEGLKNLATKAGQRLMQAGQGRKRRKQRSVSNLRLVGRSVAQSAAKRRRRAPALGTF